MASTTGQVRPNPHFLFHPCRTLKVTTGTASVNLDAVNLVAASSRFGLVFVGYDKGFKIYRLEDIQNCDVDSEGRGPFENCPGQTVATTNDVVLVALSADDLTLAVVLIRDSVPVADMYDVRGFARQVPETLPFFSVRLSSQPAVGLLDFAWNPVQCGMFAACLTDGSAANYEICGEGLKVHGNLSASAGAKALAWSPKGKQVVVGKQDGSLVQYKPTMQEAKTLAPPTLFENPVQVVSVCWIAPTVFAVVYLPSGNVDDPQPTLVITAFTKTSPVCYTAFDELCLKTGTHPKERFWLYHQPDWGILLFASRNSNEIAVLGCTSQDKMKWEQWELDSDGRAEVPLHKADDTFPLGLALSYCAQRNIVGKLQTWPPMPILFLFSTSGALSPFHMKNLAPGVPTLVRPPEPLTTDGQRKPMANAPRVEVPRLAPAVPAAPDRAALSKPLSAAPAGSPFQFGATSTTGTAAAPQPVTPQPPQPFASSAGTGGTPSPFAFGSTGGSSFTFGTTSTPSAATSNSTSKPTSVFSVPSMSSTNFGGPAAGAASVFSTGKSSSATGTPGIRPGLPSAIASSASAASTASPFAFGTAATLTTGTTVSSASAFSFVPKQNVSSPSPSQPASAAGPGRIAKAAESEQDVRKPEPSKPSVLPETASKRISDNAIASAIAEEMKGFEKELKEFKEQSSKPITSTAVQADMNRLRENTTNMEEVGETLKKDLNGLNNDIHVLSSLVLEAFAAAEEGRTQELRNRDPRFRGLLHSRRLDPVTAQRLLEIRRLHQYLESQLRDVHTRLDLEWQECMTKQKEKSHRTLPSVQATYQVIGHCQSTSRSLVAQVDALSHRVKEMKAQGKLSSQPAHWDKRGSQATTDELSALADSLLRTNLSRKGSGEKDARDAETAAPVKTRPMSLRKQAQLAEYFGQQSVTPVRARLVANASESRLLSKLSLLMKESSQAPEQKVHPVSSLKEAEDKPNASFSTAADSTVKETHKGIADAQPEATPTPKMKEEKKTPLSDPFHPLTSTPVKGFAPPVGSITSGVAQGKTVAAPTRVPITKVIEVSVSAAERVPVIPSGLTITPIAPPEVTTVAAPAVSKPGPADASAPKPFGTASPFGPVFSFGKTGTPVTFNFGTEPAATAASGPGPGGLKSPAPTSPAPTLPAPMLPAPAVTESKPAYVQEKLSGAKTVSYEDVSPTGSPPHIQKSMSASDLATKLLIKDMTVPASVTPSLSTTASPTTHAPATASTTTTTTIAVTTAATTTSTVSTSLFSLPVASSSSTSSLFKLNFGQPGAAKKTSIFGNVAQSALPQGTPGTAIFGNAPPPSDKNTGTASSAAAFSFTAALAATKEAQASTAGAKAAPSATVTVAMATAPVVTITAAALPAPVSSFSAVTTAAGSALFQPVSTFGSTALTQPTSYSAMVPPTSRTSQETVAVDSSKTVSSADTPAQDSNSATSVVAGDNNSRAADVVPPVSAIAVPRADEKESQQTTPALEIKPLNLVPATTVASPFGQTATIFGKPQAASSVPAFGQSPPAFAKAVPTSTQLPTQGSNSTALPSFGQTTTSSPFWKPTSTFLQTTPTSVFGQSSMTSGTSAFGSSAPPVFGQSSVFVSVQPTTESSPFGQMSSASTGTGGSLFGQKTAFGFQQTSPPFGQSESLFGQKTSFGQGSVSAFGQQQGTCTFGDKAQEQQTAAQGSLFGGSGFLSGLGAKPSGEGSPKNVFGGASSFGSGTQSTGLFGGQGASSFGTSFGAGGFSGGSFSAGGGSVAQSGFGTFQQQTPTKPAAFGGPPAFGGSPSFGGPPQFGGSPAFGSSPTVFGSSPSFGSPQQPQPQPSASSFSVFGSSEGPTFGSLAAQGQGPQQQQQSLGFGSSFGTAAAPPPSFGSPGFGDQSTPRPSSAFSQWRQ